MKKTTLTIVIVLMVLGFGWSLFCIVDDAVHRRGYNWQTAQEYRWNVSEGKEAKK